MTLDRDSIRTLPRMYRTRGNRDYISNSYFIYLALMHEASHASSSQLMVLSSLRAQRMQV